MALTKKQKESLVNSYEEGLAKAPHAFLVGFSGLTVPEDDRAAGEGPRDRSGLPGGQEHPGAARGGRRGSGGARRSFRRPDCGGFIRQTIAVSLAKALTEFAKEVPALEFKGGLVDSQVVEPEQIKDIASLPSREELIAKLLFLLQSPVTGLARVLNAVTRDFVVVLDQIGQNKES